MTRRFVSICLAGSVTWLAIILARADGADPPTPPRPSDEIGERYYVYEEKFTDFGPGGWMPGGDIALSLSVEWSTNPYAGKNCWRSIAKLSSTRDLWMGVACLARRPLSAGSQGECGGEARRTQGR